MKNKSVKLIWYVYNHDFNNDKMIKVNALTNDLKEDIVKSYRKGNIKSLEELKECTKKYFNWRYNHRAECEYLMGGLFSKESKFEKMCMYDELEMNLDRIVEYINYKMQLNLK